MKTRWQKILRHNLIAHPARASRDKLYRHEHRNDFFPPEDLIVTIKTKRKHYTFGGPIYSEKINHGQEEIKISKLHSSSSHKIKWVQITEIHLRFQNGRTGGNSLGFK